MDHDRLAKQLEQLVPDLRRRAEALRALGSISDGFPAGQAADQRLAEADRVERLVGLYRAGEVDGLRIELYALAYGLIRDGAVKLDT